MVAAMTARRAAWCAPLVLVLALGLAGCGSGSGSQAQTAATSLSKPAGANPSISSKMVCTPQTQSDVQQSLGVQPTQVTTPTWVNHLYTCRYVYPNGSFALSVKELSSTAETNGYYDQQAGQLGRRPDRIALGQGAFLTTGGSLIVRKNYKVMTVDTSQLPAQFGNPPQVPSDVALSVAAIIMTCWKDE
jgi:hypothetical protein